MGESRKGEGMGVGKLPLETSRGHVLARVPRGPLALHLALPNRVLGGGACAALTPHASRLSCATILLCDLHRSAADRTRTPLRGDPLVSPAGLCLSASPPSMSTPELEKKLVLRDDARRDPRRRKREVSARAADRCRSHSKIVAQESLKGVREQCCARTASEHTIW